MTTQDPVIYRIDDSIGWITLNRPAAANALDRTMLELLWERLAEAGSDSGVRAVVITGAGDRIFSAGADISYLRGATPLEVRALARFAVRVTRAIESLGKPVVAAINGHALGGGLELAEACTLRVAATGARLGHPEVRIGAIAGWGGTTRLARLIGRGRAAELLLTGETLSAEQALRLGLVNRVVGADELAPAVESLLRDILANAPLAVEVTWEALLRGADMSLEESAWLGADLFGLVAATDDFREGTEAFLEKRRPSFENR